MTTPCVVGIDVAKDQLDIAVQPSGAHWRVAHDASGVAELVTRLDGLAPTLVVLEASGGDERTVVAALGAAGLPVAAVNPRQPRDVARATGRLAKTDRLDADTLARFAQAVQPPARPAPTAEAQVLAATLARRRQLLEMLNAERNRRLIAVAAIRPQLDLHIAWLKEALTEVDRDLERQVGADPSWRERAAVLRSVPGVGRVVSTTLLADLPALGQRNRRQLAALIGVAPLADDSGQRRGKRTTWGGRAPVRCTVSMATIVATRYNPVIRAVSERLVAAGKPKQVAFVAGMRKVLTILNAMVRHGTPWTPAPSI